MNLFVRDEISTAAFALHPVSKLWWWEWGIHSAMCQCDGVCEESQLRQLLRQPRVGRAVPCLSALLYLVGTFASCRVPWKL